MLTSLKVTAYVQTPALRDTLAEKHVTKILKCFTVSAALCILTGDWHDDVLFFIPRSEVNVSKYLSQQKQLFRKLLRRKTTHFYAQYTPLYFILFYFFIFFSFFLFILEFDTLINHSRT
jgi:hypothetical protein